MKLKSENYNSPLPKQGRFDEVFIEEQTTLRNRFTEYYEVKFVMYYLLNNVRVELATETLGFDPSSNKPTMVKVANPLYEETIEGSEKEVIINLFNPDFSFAIDPRTTPFEIVDYGFPDYATVFKYFAGGSNESPELLVTNDLAKGFILSRNMNGEPIGNQFKFVE